MTNGCKAKSYVAGEAPSLGYALSPQRQQVSQCSGFNARNLTLRLQAGRLTLEVSRLKLNAQRSTAEHTGSSEV